MKYEYKVIKPYLYDLEITLNTCASSGWEFVGMWQERYRDMDTIERSYCSVVLRREQVTPQ